MHTSLYLYRIGRKPARIEVTLQQPMQQPACQYIVGFDNITRFGDSCPQEHVAKNRMPLLIAGIQDIKDVFKDFIDQSVEFELLAIEYDSTCWCLIRSSFQQVHKFRMSFMQIAINEFRWGHLRDRGLCRNNPSFSTRCPDCDLYVFDRIDTTECCSNNLCPSTTSQPLHMGGVFFNRVEPFVCEVSGMVRDIVCGGAGDALPFESQVFGMCC